jgi:tRNA(His) 5'-end guanylyltransferase
VSTLLELLRKITTVLHDTAEMLGSKDSVDDQFMDMIDDLVVMSEKDSELAEGLRWIDVQSQRNGLTFYEMAMVILRKHMAERRAKEWLKGKFNK